MQAKKSALALTLGLGLSLFGTASPAHAAAVVTDTEDATLVSRGVAAAGSYTVTCSEGESVEIYTGLAQRVGGGRVATGGTGTVLTCTGEAQEVAYTVQAFSGVAFKTGRALLTVAVVDCSEFGCSVLGEASQEIGLRKR